MLGGGVSPGCWAVPSWQVANKQKKPNPAKVDTLQTPLKKNNYFVAIFHLLFKKNSVLLHFVTACAAFLRLRSGGPRHLHLHAGVTPIDGPAAKDPGAQRHAEGSRLGRGAMGHGFPKSPAGSSDRQGMYLVEAGLVDPQGSHISLLKISLILQPPAGVVILTFSKKWLEINRIAQLSKKKSGGFGAGETQTNNSPPLEAYTYGLVLSLCHW